jgi:hypothetical protein
LPAPGNKYSSAFLGETLRNTETDPALPPVTSATLPESLPVTLNSCRNWDETQACHR